MENFFNDTTKNYTLDDFFDIMRRLTADDGCPWDRVQTHDSLKKYLIEESYEVADAIENDDKVNLCEELGDVLLQVVFHSILAENNSEFVFADVINNICKKMIYRHPHIFSDTKAENADIVNDNWDSIKKAEKGYKNNTEVLRAVPKAMPALMRGQKIISKAEKFEPQISLYEKSTEISNEKENIISKNNNNVYDDTINLLNTLKSTENRQLEGEMEIVGNILLGIIKISSNRGINAEYALTKALEKFINRFDDFENN